MIRTGIVEEPVYFEARGIIFIINYDFYEKLKILKWLLTTNENKNKLI